MKMKRISITLAVFAMAALLLPALLWAGPGMDKHNGQQFGEQMAKALNLTADQKTLMDAMHAAQHNFRMAWRDAQKTVGQTFSAETAKDKPDFAQAASTVKSAVPAVVNAAFNAMVDARAKFLQSLTAEQRAALAKFHAEHQGRMMHDQGEHEDLQP
jgi:Spy/CpxP family protein refolding chaperone